MKRLPRDLPAFGGCIHFISCHHFRPVHRGISQLGVLEPHAFDVGGTNPFRWRFVERNKTINSDLLAIENISDSRMRRRDCRREFKGREEDLYCDEEMVVSDPESPRHNKCAGGRAFETSGGEVEILHRQLRIRRNQIIRSLGRVPGNTPPKSTETGSKPATNSMQGSKVQESRGEVRAVVVEQDDDQYVEVQDYGAMVYVGTTCESTVDASAEREAVPENHEKSKVLGNLHKVCIDKQFCVIFD